MSELQAWACSGAMALTGRPDGPPRAAPGAPATYASRALERTAEATARRTGTRPSLPDVTVLGERAAAAGFNRNGPWSCGGAFRALPTRDGWLALSLPRPDDVDLVPALVEGDAAGDPWRSVEVWAGSVRTADAVARGRLLGLACAGLPPDSDPGRAPVVVRRGVSRRQPERPRVLDLTSLWAGPLCANLLGLCGAEVTKVESTSRPDGARFGPMSFFTALHRGHRMVSLDLRSSAGLAELRRLIETSDLVLEASRRRALLQLGIDAEEYVDAGISWLSITALGRTENVVGFGDDVAAGAGLYLVDDGSVLPCGDALADPLTGLAAASAAAEALMGPHSVLLDVSMHAVSRQAALGKTEPHRVWRRGPDWWVESDSGTFRVEPPRERPGF